MKDSGPRDLLKRARVDEAGRFKAGNRWDAAVDRLEHSFVSSSSDAHYFADPVHEPSLDARAATPPGTRAEALFDRSMASTNLAEMEMIQTVHAKLQRVDSRLDALHEWVQETRAWTEKVEGGQKMKRRLEKMLQKAQTQAESMLSEAEVRARQIVDEAEARARKAAKQIVRDAEERSRKIIRRAEKASALLREEAADEREAVDAERRVIEGDRSETRPVDVVASQQLFESIQVFVRTNSALLDELNSLLGAMGLESTPD